MLRKSKNNEKWKLKCEQQCCLILEAVPVILVLHWKMHWFVLIIIIIIIIVITIAKMLILF